MVGEARCAVTVMIESELLQARTTHNVKPITDVFRQRPAYFCDDVGFSLIMEGCKIARLESWEELCQPDVRKSLLLSAIRENRPNHVRMLLVISESASRRMETSFDIDSRDAFGIQGCTLLYEAARAGHIAVIEALLEAGASADLLDEDTCLQPAHIALFHQHHQAAELLGHKATGGIQDVSYSDIEHASRRAAMLGHLEAIRAIFAIHKHVDHTALPQAAAQGHRDVVAALLECSARVGQADEKGFTALHHAAKRGDGEMVLLLLANKAAPNAYSNGAGKLLSPLHVASNAKVVEILLAYGTNVNVRAGDGRTPYHMAMSDGRMEVAMALVEAGADHSIPNPLQAQNRQGLCGCKTRDAPRRPTMVYQPPGWHQDGDKGTLHQPPWEKVAGEARGGSTRHHRKGLLALLGHSQCSMVSS